MKFVLMTDEIFRSAEKEWRKYLDKKARQHFAEQYQVLLDAVQLWLMESKQGEQGDKKYFAVYDKSSDSCLAIINVTHVHPRHPTKSYFKSLAFRTHPRFDSRNGYAGDEEIQRFGETLLVLNTFVFGAIKLLISGKYAIRAFKIYGNHQMDTGFFYTMISRLDKKASLNNRVTWEFCTFAQYNKWLEITLT